jgi:hypothetical protein
VDITCSNNFPQQIFWKYFLDFFPKFLITIVCSMRFCFVLIHYASYVMCERTESFCKTECAMSCRFLSSNLNEGDSTRGWMIIIHYSLATLPDRMVRADMNRYWVLSYGWLSSITLQYRTFLRPTSGKSILEYTGQVQTQRCESVLASSTS